MEMAIPKKWPKVVPELSDEQKRISDDFVGYWLEVFSKRYGWTAAFGHKYVARHVPESFLRTLEIGAGLGEHLTYETLSLDQRREYVALDVRQNVADRFKERFPDIQVCVGDCQKRLDFPNDHFDRILAIHVLEHLPNLPAAIVEMHRLCDKHCGVFSVVIPCEGSAAYVLARRLSAQRIFEKRYKQSYGWFIEMEHLNRPTEIMTELQRWFRVENRSFFPLPVPFAVCNLCIGLTLRPISRHGSWSKNS